jgi:hypothetical protein
MENTTELGGTRINETRLILRKLNGREHRVAHQSNKSVITSNKENQSKSNKCANRVQQT